jgi:hypothetical protein
MAETDPTGSVVTTTSPFLRDVNHVRQGEHSNLNDLHQGLSFGGELEYSENELDDLFSNIAGLQPDDIQTNVFMGDANRALDAEAFDSMTETANSMLDDICEPKSDATPERVTIVVYIAASQHRRHCGIPTCIRCPVVHGFRPCTHLTVLVVTPKLRRLGW